MDASAVALSVGFAFKRLTFRPVFRLSFHFGLFQALMPMLGWAAGTTISRQIEAFDHCGFRAARLRGGQHDPGRAGRREAERFAKDPTRGSRLVMLAVATSIDALAVGLSLAMLRVQIWYPSLVIGLVAALCTLAGMLLGHRCGAALGRRMELVGGALLILIGTRIVYTHLVA